MKENDQKHYIRISSFQYTDPSDGGKQDVLDGYDAARKNAKQNRQHLVYIYTHIGDGLLISQFCPWPADSPHESHPWCKIVPVQTGIAIGSCD